MEGQIPPPAPATQTNLNLESRQQAQVQTQQQLFKLPIGAQFNAAVIGGDKNGNAIIKFGGNDLILSSPIALSKGAQLALKVDGNSGTITLSLLSIDGKLPATQAQATSNQLQNPSQPNGQLQGNLQNQAPILKLLSIAPSTAGNVQGNAAAANAAQNPAAQSAAPAQAVVVGSAATAVAKGILVAPLPKALQTLRANITNSVPADQANKVLQSIPANLKSGSEVNFKINNIQPPANPQSSSDGKVHTENRTLGNQNFMSQQAPQSSGQNTSQNAGTTPNSSPQNQQALLTAAKSTFTPAFQTAADGTVKVNALVTGVNSSSQLVVETALGKLSVTTSIATNKISLGSVLNLQLSNFGTISQTAPEPQNPVQNLAQDWTALRELNQALTKAGQPNTLNKLAGLDSIFASRLIAFMGAVKNNNMGNWLSSELMDVLDEATREQIVGKLRGDFTNLNRLLNDNPSNSWQTLLFPVFDGEELHQARLHLKYLEDENGEIDKDLGSRFLVELEASYFGEMQFDGLVRKQGRSSNFDLIIRTHKPLESDVELDIRTIFGNAQELTGFKGSIDFATHKEFPIRPMDERLSKDLHKDGSIQA